MTRRTSSWPPAWWGPRDAPPNRPGPAPSGRHRQGTDDLADPALHHPAAQPPPV